MLKVIKRLQKPPTSIRGHRACFRVSGLCAFLRLTPHSRCLGCGQEWRDTAGQFLNNEKLKACLLDLYITLPSVFNKDSHRAIAYVLVRVVMFVRSRVHAYEMTYYQVVFYSCSNIIKTSIYSQLAQIYS